MPHPPRLCVSSKGHTAYEAALLRSGKWRRVPCLRLQNGMRAVIGRNPATTTVSLQTGTVTAELSPYHQPRASTLQRCLAINRRTAIPATTTNGYQPTINTSTCTVAMTVNASRRPCSRYSRGGTGGADRFDGRSKYRTEGGDVQALPRVEVDRDLLPEETHARVSAAFQPVRLWAFGTSTELESYLSCVPSRRW